jgi:CRP-like cAMP-binding protein
MADRSSQIRAALIQVPWIAEAGDEMVAPLVDASRWLVLRKGEELFSRGQTFEHLAVIASGSIESSLSSVRGRRHLTSVMQRGQVMGFNALFLGRPAQGSHVALEPTEVVLIRGDEALRLMQSSRAMMLGVLREQSRRMEHLLDMLGDRHLLSAPARVARLLLLQSRWYAPAAEGAHSVREVRLTHQRLADLCSLTRQSVSAELERFQAMGLVRIKYGGVELLDEQALERLVACES